MKKLLVLSISLFLISANVPGIVPSASTSAALLFIPTISPVGNQMPLDGEGFWDLPLESLKQTNMSDSANYADADLFQFPVGSADDHSGWDRPLDFGGVGPLGPGHLGEDYALPNGVDSAGQPVYATANGIVVYATGSTSTPGYGGVVVIEHHLPNGEYYTSVTGHLAHPVSVTTSSTVQKGQLIGYVADDANDGGNWQPHVHFGIRNGRHDPGTYYCNCCSDPGSYWVYVGYERTCDSHFMISNWQPPTMFVKSHGGPSSANGASLYAEPNYRGVNYIAKNPGAIDLTQSFGGLSLINKGISSIGVEDGWAVKLFENGGFSGGCLIVDSNKPGLTSLQFHNGHSVDNNIRSLSVHKYQCPAPCPTVLAVGTQRAPASTQVASSGICSGSIPPTPTPTPILNVDGAAFVFDVTYPDGAVVSPGQAIVKTWRLRNIGTTIWSSGYKLKFVRGEQMGAPNEVSVPVTSPGSTADISVNMTAPNSTGNHAGYWRLWSPSQNGFFGPEIYVLITVPNGPTPPPSGTGDVTLQCLDCPSVVTPGQQFRPTIRAAINIGQLLAARGDMLLATSNPNYTYQEFPHIGVTGNHYAGESYNFQFYADHPIVAPTTEGTYESRWRIWRDNNWAGDELTIRFTVRNNGGTAPDVPTLVSPADGWTDFQGCSTLPQLSVQSQGAGIQFNFQVDPSAPQNSGWVNGPSWTPASLGQTEHIWRVKARNASTGLESDWSSQRRFTCSSTNYSIPYMLFSPASPTSVDRVKIWTCADVPSEVGRGIEVYANTATDGSNSGEWRRVWPVLNGDCTADWQNHPEWWPEEDLRFLSNGTHLIQARAWAGPRDNPIKSMVRESLYTLIDRRPAQVRQISPETQQWFNSRTITFRWEPEEILRSEQFVVQVSTNPNPSISPIVSQTLGGSAREFTYTFNQDYPALYWGIKACRNAGSPCSDLGSIQFGIDRIPAASFVTTLPITTYDTVQTVTWQCADNANGSGCQRYDVQMRDGLLGEWQDWRTAITEISGLFRGLPGHQYCFRSRALDQAGNLETWPASANGDTCTTIDLDNQSPVWWNANYSSKRKLTVLNWDAHSLNTGFPVHAHFDTTTSPTAAEIYNGSQTVIKGDDVRVVYQDTTEISRFIQTFTSSTIDIWFDLQTNIGPNPGNNADYQLYYGNPAAGSPPADPGNVFMPHKDSGVVASWYLTEWGGSTAADNSGNGHTATRVNGGQWVTTVRGPAIDLVKDSKQYLIVNDPTSLNLTAFTFEAWFWRDHSDVGALISKWRDGENDSSYLFGIWQRKMMLRLRSPSGQFFETPEGEQSNINFQDNVGYHVAATYDGSTVRFYVNGELQYTKDWTNGIAISSKNVFLGVQQSPNGDPPYSLDGYFDGLLGGVRISNYARTSFPYASFALVTNAPEVMAGAEATYESPTIQPDLAVLSLTTYPASVNQGGGLIAQAIVKNQGTRATRNGAWTMAYADHQPTIGDLNGISFWSGTPIEAGTIATLTTYITQTSALSTSSLSTGQARAESNHTLYVQADATGVIKDSNRANNISTGVQACLASADIYEPNDSAQAATPIAIGSPAQANFHGTEDQDWFRFTAQGGVTYTLQTSNLGTAADTYLYLYGTDGSTLLASNDDYDGSLASYLEWTAPVTGTYYAMVRGWNPSAGGCGTTYDFAVARALTHKAYLPLIRK